MVEEANVRVAEREREEEEEEEEEREGRRVERRMAREKSMMRLCVENTNGQDDVSTRCSRDGGLGQVSDYLFREMDEHKLLTRSVGFIGIRTAS